MTHISVNEARARLADLIDSVAQGQSVAISRRGRPVVQLSPISPRHRPSLPDLAAFRKSLGDAPRKPAATLRRLREQDRY